MSADRLEYFTDRRPGGAVTNAHVERVGSLRGMTVWRVDGAKLRRDVDIDFTMGGSGARYQYCPLNEIWIEVILRGTDAAATILHEYVEYHLMRYSGLSYDEAHDIASEHELAFRQRGRGGMRAVDRYLSHSFNPSEAVS
jgi:hypothetical protein